jgi:hypothetical protein
MKVLDLSKGSMPLMEIGWYYGEKMNQASIVQI